MGKITRDYYVLSPVYDTKNTIYVPADNQNLVAKMKRLLTQEEIYAVIDAAQDNKAKWIEDDRARDVRFKEIIEQGDRKEIIGMIAAIFEHKQEAENRGKRLHSADEKLLGRAEKMIHEEIALVLNINDDRNDVPFDTTKQSQEEENDSIPSQEKTVVYYDCASGSSGAPLYDEVSKYLVSENVSFESFDSLKLEALSGEISDPDITDAKIQRAFEFLQANITSEVLTAIQDSTDVVVNHNGDYYLKVNVSFKYTSDIAVVFYINLSDFQ